MENKVSKHENSALKILGIAIFIIGFTGTITCNAQSVVGKWKRTFTKIFVTDKTTGKQVPVSDEMQKSFDEHANTYNETLEIKSDNTYISTVSAGSTSSPTIHNGVYSLSGKILDMNIPMVHNEKTTISIQSLNEKTMVWDLVFMGKLTEIFYTKMP
jgi:hypothetical protein